MMSERSKQLAKNTRYISPSKRYLQSDKKFNEKLVEDDKLVYTHSPRINHQSRELSSKRVSPYN